MKRTEDELALYLLHPVDLFGFTMISPTCGLDIGILRRLVSEHNPEAFFKKAALAAAELVGGEGAALLEVVSPEEAHYRFVKGIPEGHQKLIENLRFRYQGTTIEAALQSGDPVFTPDYPKLPRAIPAFVASGLKATLVIPCGPRGQCNAILAIAWFIDYPKRMPSQATLDFLMLIGDLMHAALYRQSLEDDLARQAQHDVLTGLPNRRYLASYFCDTLRPSLSQTTQAAVALLDLDNFKQVNDQLGHVTGDLLLCLLAERLSGFLEKGDMAARLGGDEFVLVLSRDVRYCLWEALFDRLSKVLDAPYIMEDGTVLDCRASVGVTADIGLQPLLETCLRDADHALYALKRRKHERARSWQLYEEGDECVVAEGGEGAEAHIKGAEVLEAKAGVFS